MSMPKKDIKDLLDEAEFEADVIDLLRMLAESEEEVDRNEAIGDVVEHLMTVDRPNFRRVVMYLLEIGYHLPVELVSNIEMLFDIVGHVASLDDPEVNKIIYNTALESGMLDDR